ncbi:MAG: 16S rRNA (guanine(966)-N(2))-methyltransferase RsmD [Clostridia bacterium]|nr:16S rRNA (guanine(966)-N(2))-methyltransferase RsmD [Clostridia bacterium]
MRVITGSARGVRLQTLDGLDVRPTTERVKEAVFSMIQFDLEGRRFLDLFTGSGQMGIEALSRGAEKAWFVDASKASLETARKNLVKAKLIGKGELISASAESFLARTLERFDIAFLDPPYHKNILDTVLPALEPHINAGGAVICETAADEVLPESVGGLAVYRTYRYSQTVITVYRK